LKQSILVIKKLGLGQFAKQKSSPVKMNVQKNITDKLINSLKKKSLKNLLLKLSFNKNILKKKKLTTFKIYKKEFFDSPKFVDINPVLSIFKQINRHKNKKKLIKNLIFSNNFLTTKSLTFFKKYFSISTNLILKKKLKRKKHLKRLNIKSINKTILNNSKKLTHTILLKSLFSNRKTHQLLIKIHKTGVKTSSFAKLLKIYLNPSVSNFFFNQDFLIENDNNIDSYIADRISAKIPFNTESSKFTNVGYI